MANVNSNEIGIEYNRVRYSYYRVAENEIQAECATTVDKKINRVFVQGVSPSRIKGIDTYINFNDGFTSCITLPHPATLQPQEYCVTWGIPNREDIDGWLQSPANSSNAKLLKNIAVYDRSTPNEKVIWTFNYGYFEGENNSGFDLPIGSAYSYSGANPVGITHKKRLKLSSVVFPDSTSSTFNYYGEDTGFNFKTRFTYGLDHWGYINGNDGNIQNYGLIGSDELASCGANRSTNSGFLRYGSLEKITNSTGNETHFEYEPNFASNYGNGLIPIGGLRIKSIRNKDLIRNTDIKTEYDYTNAGISTGFLCLAPIYRFDKPNGYRVANSALYDILLAETGRLTVGYSQVTERTIDVANSIQTGKIVEHFDQSLEQLTLAKEGEECFFDENLQEMVCFTTLVYPLNYFIIPPDFTNGNLIKQEVFNEANQKLSEVNYTYTPNNGIKTDSVFYVRRVRLNGVDDTKQYYLHQKKYRMEETTKKQFSQDGSGVPMTSTVAVTYKDEMPQSYRDTYKGKHNLPVKTTTTDT